MRARYCIMRALQAPATTLQTLFNSVNILLGVGVLTVPYATAEGGWAAVGVLALLGVITNYTGECLLLRVERSGGVRGEHSAAHPSTRSSACASVAGCTSLMSGRRLMSAFMTCKPMPRSRHHVLTRVVIIDFFGLTTCWT